MILPKGNTLFEKVTLSYPDINILLNNLAQQGFTGYVKLAYYKKDGIIFYSHGKDIRSIEMNESNIDVFKRSRVLSLARKSDVDTSVYILSPRISQVLSSIFAFQPLYLDYEVKEKELKKVMSTLQADAYTGIIEFVTRDGKSYILLDQGEIVVDSFAPEYGQIISGINAVSKFLDFVSSDGATINIFAEKQEEINSKIKLIEEEMEKIKELVLKVEKGLFKANDVFWVDEYIIQEWGIRNPKSLKLELVTSDGVVHIVKGQAGRRLGGNISTVASNMKKLKLKEGDAVSVRPIV